MEEEEDGEEVGAEEEEDGSNDEDTMEADADKKSKKEKIEKNEDEDNMVVNEDNLNGTSEKKETKKNLQNKKHKTSRKADKQASRVSKAVFVSGKDSLVDVDAVETESSHKDTQKKMNGGNRKQQVGQASLVQANNASGHKVKSRTVSGSSNTGESTASGSREVTSKTPNKYAKAAGKTAVTVYKVQETETVMKVEVEQVSGVDQSSTPKQKEDNSGQSPAQRTSQRKGKKRPVEDDEEEDSKGKKLTSKQRRRLEREAREKKVGQHYYATANIKNRRNRR